MTQNFSSPTLPRTTTNLSPADGEDLDALLDSIMGDDPGPRQARAEGVSTREVARQRLIAQRAEEQRARQAERVNDELRAQIRALAMQVQVLSEASATQASQGRAIQELRQAMREVVVATHKQREPQGPYFNAELQLPSLQIKLVLSQAAHLLHEADKDVAVLGSWAMLFAGTGFGTLLSIFFSLSEPYTTRFWIYIAIAVFAFLVALVFVFLTRQARRRAANARRAMDESTLTRTIPVGN